MDGEHGDLLLFAADKNKVVWDVLGASSSGACDDRWIFLDKNEYKFLWVTEFPLLEWSEEQNRFTAMHHPFTMPMEEDLPVSSTVIREESVQKHTILYLNGNEIGGGSVRIHQD